MQNRPIVVRDLLLLWFGSFLFCLKLDSFELEECELSYYKTKLLLAHWPTLSRHLRPVRGPSPRFWRHRSSPRPACVWFPGTVASLRVWTVGTRGRLLWGDRRGRGFLCEAWKPGVRRRCPWSSFWLQPCGAHRTPLGDMEGFAVNRLCPEILGDSPLAQLCSVRDLPSLPFNGNRWSLCRAVFAGEQNLSFLAGSRP